MFKRILLAYDGSGGSRHALERAAELARLGPAEVVVLAVGRLPDYAETVDEVEEARERAERYCGRHLDEALAALEAAGVAARRALAYGKPSEEILRKAAEIGADLIILGTHPHHPVRRRLLGATADKVVDHAECSVLVVK